jgi:transcription termination factor NusB
MLDNNLYNLMMQMVEENKSVWRIKTNYEQDAAGCDECLSFWKRLLEDKERHIEEIEQLIRSHIDERQSEKVPNLLEK